MKKFWIIRIVLFGIVAFTVMTGVTMYLWNWLVPLLFHGPAIEFWQGRDNRLHDRLLFSKKKSGKWKLERLSP